MAKSENQKQKLIRLLEIFMRYTDDDNGITVNEIIMYLNDYGISAERKSLYSDFLELEAIGFPIIRLYGNPPRYTLGDRIFELAELKLLVDAVQSSKFISGEESAELIEKLKLFAGVRAARELDRQVFVKDRERNENVSTLGILDTVHKAISLGRQISFACFDYNAEKKKVLRHGGIRYKVSPKNLILKDENYYLIAYDEAGGVLKSFRVDKMVRVRLEEDLVSIAAEQYRYNPADYIKKNFGMCAGREELVTIEAREHLADAVIDRFGRANSFIKTPFGFRTVINVMVSPAFFSWVMSFGADMRILLPVAVRDELYKMLKEIIGIYE